MFGSFEDVEYQSYRSPGMPSCVCDCRISEYAHRICTGLGVRCVTFRGIITVHAKHMLEDVCLYMNNNCELFEFSVDNGSIVYQKTNAGRDLIPCDHE